jgi:hypothetical protein
MRPTYADGMNSPARAIILIVLILLLFGLLPVWPYSAGWGYYPFGGIGLIILIVALALLFGKNGALRR